MITPAVRWSPRARLKSRDTAAHPSDEIGVLPPALATLLAATDRALQAASWERFVERYTPLLLHTVHRLAHSYDDAMDRYAYLLDQLSRDDFHRLRGFTAVGPGRFSTWLVVVAHRLLVDYHRQRYGRLRLETAADQHGVRTAARLRRQLVEMVGEELHPSAIGDTSTDPEGGTYGADCTTALQAALNRLEPRDQLLLNLRFDKELAAREIADIIGLRSQFHVYRRLKTVLAELRRMLPQAFGEYVGAIPWSDLSGKGVQRCPCTDAAESCERGGHARPPRSAPREPGPSQSRGDRALHRSHAAPGRPARGGTPPG